jgi:nucleoside 2-deoxyribosyltransferase
MYIYIAAPLCSEAEKSFNIKLNNFIKKLGIKTYLPQLDGGIMSEIVATGEDEEKTRERLFNIDINKMKECDTILIVLDGRTIDEGACFELGYVCCLGKTCLGFKTDSRSFIRGKNNLMIDKSLEKIFYTWDSLKEYLTRSGKK